MRRAKMRAVKKKEDGKTWKEPGERESRRGSRRWNVIYTHNKKIGAKLFLTLTRGN